MAEQIKSDDVDSVLQKNRVASADVDKNGKFATSALENNSSCNKIASVDGEDSATDAKPSHVVLKPSFLRPSALAATNTAGVAIPSASSSSSTTTTITTITTTTTTTTTAAATTTTTSSSQFLLKTPKLNLENCKFASADSIPDSIFNSYFNEKPKDSSKHCDESASNHVDKEKRSHTKSTTTSLANPNFVFGENLHERVTASTATEKPSLLLSSSPSPASSSLPSSSLLSSSSSLSLSSSSSVSASTSTPSSSSSSNGTSSSEMLFTSLTKEQQQQQQQSKDVQQSLLEDAARCEEARATSKRKYEEVQVSTGEEDETNILHMNVKLFAFENGSWIERGRGVLRLNDFFHKEKQAASSRVVVRTLGSLKVVLNSKIWPGMEPTKASEKSLRLTAVDPYGHPKIYLIQAGPSDISSLYQNIEMRVRLSKTEEEREKRFKTETQPPQQTITTTKINDEPVNTSDTTLSS